MQVVNKIIFSGRYAVGTNNARNIRVSALICGINIAFIALWICCFECVEFWATAFWHPQQENCK